MMLSTLHLTWALLAAPSPIVASDTTPRCSAPYPPHITTTLFPDDSWGTGSDSLPSPSYLTSRLAWTYDLYLADVYGTPSRAIKYWVLTLRAIVPDDSLSPGQTYLLPPRARPLLAARLEWQAGWTMADSTKVMLDIGPRLQAWLWATPGDDLLLRLLTDAWPIDFVISEIHEDGSLHGSWQYLDESWWRVAAGPVQLIEHPAGYFCAFPRPQAPKRAG